MCCENNRNTYSAKTQLDALDENTYVISCNMCNIPNAAYGMPDMTINIFLVTTVIKWLSY